MSLLAMERVAARLLMQPGAARAILAEILENPSAFELTPEEAWWVSSIDLVKLDAAARGYVAKRMERIESIFPRALRILDALNPTFRQLYLSTSPPAGDVDAERRSFGEFIAHQLPVQDHEHAFLCDMIQFEMSLWATPSPSSPPAYWFRETRTRPKASPFAFQVDVRGPFFEVGGHRGLSSVPEQYAPDPALWLVVRNGGELAAEELDDFKLVLWNACDGNRTVSEILDSHGQEAKETLKRWFKQQALVDNALIS